ncbi:hypothetical protein [Cellvibrio mixtus]|uniref:hypothetical protein n=1 Tax=Cellvibrio mixtus TaxID=39650 RepID=UPI000587B53E|nr:hypothetical protein [Cellvibrio mixtus]
MDIYTRLSVLIPGEAIFALLLLLFFTIHKIIKQRKQIQKLLAKFNEMKSALQQSDGTSFYSHESTPENKDVIKEYFEHALNDSLLRYKKFTASEIPHINPDYPYSGKIAALRSIYLAAEKEVYEEMGITHAAWGTFEKRLAELIKHKNTSQQEHDDTDVKSLQDEISRLKKYQAELEQYQLESQRMINSLQSMLASVKKLHTSPDSDQQEAVAPLWDTQSINQLADSAENRNKKMFDLLQELKGYPSQFTPTARKKLEGQLNILEIELMKSDQYINNLKKELKEAQSHVINYALKQYDNNTENTSNNTANPRANDQQNIINEIQLLRKNNKQQHFIISELEREIQLLKASLDSTSETEANIKREEIHNLERLVREGQACIHILESEVDNLYEQLKGKISEQNEPEVTRDSVDVNDEINMITRELEKTVAHYQQLHAINYVIIELITSNSIEDIAKQLIQFIKSFQLPVGFSIKSLLGKAEYLPVSQFNESIKKLLKDSNYTDPITHLEEGTLFVNSKLRAILLTQAAGHPILETSLVNLISATEESIKRLEYEKINRMNNSGTHEWVDLAKNLLSNLDIQYAYQLEENRKTFNHFISELRRAYHLLDLQGPGAIVLDNSITEFEERINALTHSSEVIDKDISQLLEHMKKLGTQT